MKITRNDIVVENRFAIGLESIVGMVFYRGHTILVLQGGKVFEFQSILREQLYQVLDCELFFDGVPIVKDSPQNEGVSSILQSFWHKNAISCVTLTPLKWNRKKEVEYLQLTVYPNDHNQRISYLGLKPETIKVEKSVLMPREDMHASMTLGKEEATTEEVPTVNLIYFCNDLK